MSNHVFISYARADASDFARNVHDSLEAMGLNMWLDAEDIPKGSNWALTIQRAIMTCRAFIFVITPASYESKVCNLELQQAFEMGTP
ncbi:MAG: toll/interleukin-1 receptor domain-containing protein, partial [Phototrophicaceae bacterium]